MMGQSVEWKRLPFDFESIITNRSNNSNVAKSKYEAQKGADTSFRRNANLYSSIMGKPSNFFAMVSTPASKAADTGTGKVSETQKSLVINNFTNAAHSSINTMS